MRAKNLQLYLHTHYKSIIIAVALIVIGFFVALLLFQSQANQKLLENTKASAENTETIISNQQADLKTIKDEIARLKRFNACLLAVHGQQQLLDEEVEAQCEKMSNGVGIEDVTSRSPTAPPESTPPEETNQGQQKNQSSSNGNPEEPPEPSLSERAVEVVCSVVPNSLGFC